MADPASPEHGPLRMVRLRADLMARSRAFFAERGVLEVDTPVLGSGLVVESAIDPIRCDAEAPAPQFLLCSPEAPMKRLLAAGSGPIYQFAHAFRAGEVGRRHAPEFSMLEWYRPGFDHHALMDEVEDLVRTLLPGLPAVRFERRTYRSLFEAGAGVDPFDTSLAELRATCERLAVALPDSFDQDGLDAALDLLLVSHLEPGLGVPTPLFLHDYPASQAALARIRSDDDGHRVAERFELYIGGVELANGYHELGDADEQRQRFATANRERQRRGQPRLPVDEALLAALASGLPACAGVALGFDRLLMVAGGADHIDAVRSLPFEPPPGGDARLNDR